MPTARFIRAAEPEPVPPSISDIAGAVDREPLRAAEIAVADAKNALDAATAQLNEALLVWNGEPFNLCSLQADELAGHRTLLAGLKARVETSSKELTVAIDERDRARRRHAKRLAAALADRRAKAEQRVEAAWCELVDAWGECDEIATTIQRAGGPMPAFPRLAQVSPLVDQARWALLGRRDR
jgi:hypothetical protein